MSALKIVVLILATLLFAGGLAVLLTGGPIGAAIYLLGAGALIGLGTIFEQSRYRPPAKDDSDDWVLTSEKFIDDSTGKLMQVRHNSRTGERDYIEVDQK